MTATIHRVLMTIGGIASGMGSVWTLSEIEPLGIPSEAGAITALVAALSIIAANTIRANWSDA